MYQFSNNQYNYKLYKVKNRSFLFYLSFADFLFCEFAIQLISAISYIFLNFKINSVQYCSDVNFPLNKFHINLLKYYQLIAYIYLYLSIDSIYYNILLNILTIFVNGPSNMPQTIGNNKYTLGKVIACGSFGKVFSCFPYAIKQIKLPNVKDTHQNFVNHFKSTLQNEINILKDANHAHIVKLYEVIYENDAVYLVMEYCQSDLKMKTINKPQGEAKAIQVIGQILKGIKQMVKLGIVHRDLKPANILYNKGIYKIADFGMAKYLQTEQDCMLKSHVGTPYYMAPQILQRKKYTPKCDVWSLGVIFYELLYGRLPWTGKDQNSLLSNILNHKLNFVSNVQISSQTKQILTKILCVSQQKRLSWEELFVLFEILQKKQEVDNKVTFHRPVIQTMLNIEKERISLVEYKCRFSQLTSQKIIQVLRILQGLVDPEYGYIVRDFFKKFN